MKHALAIALLFVTFTLSAQSGNYFLSHFSPTKDRFDNVCFDMVQTANGLMYFATQGGIIQFDGLNWNLIPGTGAVYSLQVSGDVLYWAGAAGYGTIGEDDNGLPHIVTLSKGAKDVFQVIAVKDKACFVTEGNLFVLAQGQQNVIDIRRTETTGSFINIFELFGMLFVNTEHGVFKIQNDKLVPSTLALPAGAQGSFSRHF